MTIEFQQDGQAVPEKRFRVCWFGNLAGHESERPELIPRSLNANDWDKLFAALKPSLSLQLNLNDMKKHDVSIHFSGLSDFQGKGIEQKIDLVHGLNEGSNLILSANPEQPISTSKIAAIVPWLKDIAMAYQDEPALDLLSMVDIGDAPTPSGWILKRSKEMFKSESFDGRTRQAVISEFTKIKEELLAQVLSQKPFQQLEMQWRAIKQFLPLTRGITDFFVVDCAQHEICDALYLVCIKPERGTPQIFDLNLTAFSFGLGEEDLHALHHLGRMSEALQSPFVFSVDPKVLGLVSGRQLKHFKDVSGRMQKPELAKWRKQRDESGSRWLFATTNGFQMLGSESKEAMPSALYFGLVAAQALNQGFFPTELMGPQGQWDDEGQCVAILEDSQCMDLSFEGFCGINQDGLNAPIHIFGMNSMAHIKVGPGESPQARDFVESTFAFAFLVGTLSRFIQTREDSEDLEGDIKQFLGGEAEIQIEREEGLVVRIKPPFTILRTNPDIVIGLS